MQVLVEEEHVLNCTVLRVETSHPMDCITNAAILLPTYLERDNDRVSCWVRSILEMVVENSPIDDL